MLEETPHEIRKGGPPKGKKAGWNRQGKGVLRLTPRKGKGKGQGPQGRSSNQGDQEKGGGSRRRSPDTPQTIEEQESFETIGLEEEADHSLQVLKAWLQSEECGEPYDFTIGSLAGVDSLQKWYAAGYSPGSYGEAWVRRWRREV